MILLDIYRAIPKKSQNFCKLWKATRCLAFIVSEYEHCLKPKESVDDYRFRLNVVRSRMSILDKSFGESPFYERQAYWYERQIRIDESKGKELSGRGVSQEQIEAAREFSVADLLDCYDNKRIRCIFHEDNNPSARVRDNKLQCFVCNERFSSIDVFMKLQGCNFVTAVKSLIGEF